MNFFSRLKKKTATAVRSFAAAISNRLTSDWISSVLSQDGELRGSIKSLRARARDLGRNDDYVRSYLRSVENNVVGSGIRLQSNVKDSKNKNIQLINREIEKEWVSWCRMDSCHVAGTLSFQDIERLLIRNTAESGEIFVRFIYEKFGRSKIPFSLQIIEADLLDENFNGVCGDNMVRMGVEVNEFGRPQAYHFLKNHPGDGIFPQKNDSISRIRVPAKDIIHLFRQERPIQSRGFSWLASAMLSLRHLAGFIEATIVRKRSEASIMGFIQSPDAESVGVAVEGAERVEDFSPGKFAYLGPGETVNVPQISSGQSEFDPFTKSMLRKAASGVGSSYEELSKDYSMSNYSSSRLALISERDHWKMLQDWFIRNFHQKTFEKWIEISVMSGVLKINDFYLNQEKYISPKWMPRGWDWVDPLKDVTADKEALKAGLRSRSDILAEEGKDFEETMQQIAKEREFMSSLGIKTDIEIQENIKSKNNNSNQKGVSEDENQEDPEADQ